MSTMLNKPLSLYLKQLEFDSIDASPYLFFQSGDPSRNLPSSQWTALVKAVRLPPSRAVTCRYCTMHYGSPQVFKRHAGISCPPKMLR